MATLIYVADPMCSWCYGFSQELSALHEGLPEIPIELVMGGLRAHQTEALSAGQKATIQSHWEKVHATTGLPFSDRLLTSEKFIYDTEPACRAVVTSRTIAPKTSFKVMHAIQHAFYAEGRDMTIPEELAQVAAAAMTEAGHAIDAGAFLAAWSSEASMKATEEDFALTKKWGIYGFPTLILERDRELDLVTSGYLPMPALIDKLQELVDQKAAA